MALGDTGYERKRFADIFTDMDAKAKEVLGQQINTSERAPFGLILRLIAFFIGKAYQDMEAVYNSGSPSTATGNALDRVGANSGMARIAEQYAVTELTIIGTPGYVVPARFVGATENAIRFTTDQAVTIGTGGTGKVHATATVAGEKGNVAAGSITKIVNPIADVTAVTNASAAIGGLARETDAAFRARVLLKVSQPATSGNASHYIQWATSVPGVGAAKVTELWNGPGTVKVSIVDTDRQPALPALVAEVAEYLETVRPVCVAVTVVSAAGLNVNVAATVVLASGYTLQEVQDAFTTALTQHLSATAFASTYVSYAKIGTLLLGTDGVLDYTSLTLNGGTSNVVLADNQVPVVGTVGLGV